MRTGPLFVRSVAVSLLAGAAVAQGAPPLTRFVPADAQVVLRIGGPAIWRQAFAATKLATLLDGDTARPWVAKLRAGWDTFLQRAAADGMTPEVLDALVKEYRGEWVVSLCFDAEEAFASAGEREPEFAAMIVMAPDGTFDLPGLLASFRKFDAPVEHELVALQIGEHAFRATPGPNQWTQVELIDGHLVMFAGNAIERFGERMLATTGRAEKLPAPAPLSLDVDLSRIVAAIARKAAAEIDVDLPFPPERVFELLGMSNLRGCSLKCGAAGEHVELEMSVTMGDGDNGLLDMLLVDRGRPGLLRWLPAGGQPFQVAAFDASALHRMFARLLDLAGEQAAVSMVDIERQFFDRTKVRLREDLLDHLGQEVLLLGSFRDAIEVLAEAQQDGVRPDPARVLAGYCLALQLRDGKAFAASIDTMLRAAGLHAARKTEDYGDAKIHTLRLGGVLSIEYAVTDDCVLIVPGARGAGSEALRAALDARASADATLPDAVTRRLEGLADGWSGLGLSAVVDFVTTAYEFGARRREIPRAADVGAVLRTVAAELKAAGLGEVVDVTWTSKKGIRTVYRW